MHLIRQNDLLEVSDAKDRASFEQRLLQCAARLEFDVVAAAVFLASPGRPTEIYTAGNTPQAFVEASKNGDNGRRDPVLRQLMSSSRPVLYDQDLYVESGAGDLWEEQAPFGFRSGISIGMHLSGGRHFLFGMDRSAALPRDDGALVRLIGEINLFALYAQETALRVLPDGVVPTLPAKRLSPREREVLRWSAAGKTAWEVSMILSISESTVEFHIRNAMSKLGAPNKNAAVARATALSLL